MILTFQIDDRDLERLKETLKITQEDYDSLSSKPGSKPPYSSEQGKYAASIIRARQTLMLDNSPESCVVDYKPHFHHAAPDF